MTKTNIDGVYAFRLTKRIEKLLINACAKDRKRADIVRMYEHDAMSFKDIGVAIGVSGVRAGQIYRSRKNFVEDDDRIVQCCLYLHQCGLLKSKEGTI